MNELEVLDQPLVLTAAVIYAGSVGRTFDFLTSITFSVTSPNDPSLTEVVIAKVQAVQGKAAISILPTPGVDLLPYIKAGASIKASASGHQPSQDTVVTGKVVVTVHV